MDILILCSHRKLYPYEIFSLPLLWTIRPFYLFIRIIYSDIGLSEQCPMNGSVTGSCNDHQTVMVKKSSSYRILKLVKILID